jgi:glucokinase
LYHAPFAKWFDIDIKGCFQKLFGITDIFVENDVNSCAVGELIFGNAGDNFLWITVSTGIGGAIMVDGNVLHGYNSCAGEMGHLKVEFENPALCTCGQFGCTEAHGSGNAITNMFASEVSKNKELSQLLAERDLSANAKTCALLAKEGVRPAIEIYNIAGKYIGRALSYAANLVNPQKVYIGGGVSDSLELLLPAIKKEIEQATVKQSAAVEILKTSLSYDAALKGAAALVLQNKTKDSL